MSGGKGSGGAGCDQPPSCSRPYIMELHRQPVKVHNTFVLGHIACEMDALQWITNTIVTPIERVLKVNATCADAVTPSAPGGPAPVSMVGSGGAESPLAVLIKPGSFPFPLAALIAEYCEWYLLPPLTAFDPPFLGQLNDMLLVSRTAPPTAEECKRERVRLNAWRFDAVTQHAAIRQLMAQTWALPFTVTVYASTACDAMGLQPLAVGVTPDALQMFGLKLDQNRRLVSYSIRWNGGRLRVSTYDGDTSLPPVAVLLMPPTGSDPTTTASPAVSSIGMNVQVEWQSPATYSPLLSEGSHNSAIERIKNPPLSGTAQATGMMEIVQPVGTDVRAQFRAALDRLPPEQPPASDGDSDVLMDRRARYQAVIAQAMNPPPVLMNTPFPLFYPTEQAKQAKPDRLQSCAQWIHDLLSAFGVEWTKFGPPPRHVSDSIIRDAAAASDAWSKQAPLPTASELAAASVARGVSNFPTLHQFLAGMKHIAMANPNAPPPPPTSLATEKAVATGKELPAPAFVKPNDEPVFVALMTRVHYVMYFVLRYCSQQ